MKEHEYKTTIDERGITTTRDGEPFMSLGSDGTAAAVDLKPLADSLEPPRMRIMHGWLVREVDEHTCGAGGPEGHEPECGLIPEVDLSVLPGWPVPAVDPEKMRRWKHLADPHGGASERVLQEALREVLELISTPNARQKEQQT